MRPRYSSHRMKGDATPQERAAVLSLLREAREKCDRGYAIRAAGFWLNHQAPTELRPSAC